MLLTSMLCPLPLLPLLPHPALQALRVRHRARSAPTAHMRAQPPCGGAHARNEPVSTGPTHRSIGCPTSASPLHLPAPQCRQHTDFANSRNCSVFLNAVQLLLGVVWLCAAALELSDTRC